MCRAGKSEGPRSPLENIVSFLTVQAAMLHTLANPGPDRGCTNAVTLSVVHGPMEQSLGSERRADLMSRTAMPRFRGAEEVAAMVSWQCGPEFMFSAGIVFDPSGDLVKPDQSRYEPPLTLSVSPTT